LIGPYLVYRCKTAEDKPYQRGSPFANLFMSYEHFSKFARLSKASDENDVAEVPDAVETELYLRVGSTNMSSGDGSTSVRKAVFFIRVALGVD
jgi:hypothetical protein